MHNNILTIADGDKFTTKVSAGNGNIEGALHETRVPQANSYHASSYGLQADDRSKLRHILPK